MHSSITLIGMAGAGKTSLGKVLSLKLGKRFVDSDQEIEREQSMALKDIILKNGKDKFIEIEKQSILTLNFDEIVLSTGGSVIFSEDAMKYICKNSLVLYLRVRFEKILERVSNLKSRGFISEPGQTFEQEFYRRVKLYERHADHIIDNDTSIEACVKSIQFLLKK